MKLPVVGIIVAGVRTLPGHYFCWGTGLNVDRNETNSKKTGLGSTADAWALRGAVARCVSLKGGRSPSPRSDLSTPHHALSDPRVSPVA